MAINTLKNARYQDLYLAILKRPLNWSEAEKVFHDIPEFGGPITATELLSLSVMEVLSESNEPVTEENIRRKEEEVKASFPPNLEEWCETFLLKTADGYIDLSTMSGIEENYTIDRIIPFSKYYSADSYSFEEDEDGPYFAIDRANLDEFAKDYEEGKL